MIEARVYIKLYPWGCCWQCDGGYAGTRSHATHLSIRKSAYLYCCDGGITVPLIFFSLSLFRRSPARPPFFAQGISYSRETILWYILLCGWGGRKLLLLLRELAWRGRGVMWAETDFEMIFFGAWLVLGTVHSGRFFYGKKLNLIGFCEAIGRMRIEQEFCF